MIRSRGFSLLELVLTISLMALLAGIALPRMAGAVQGSRIGAASDRATKLAGFARARAEATGVQHALRADLTTESLIVEIGPSGSRTEVARVSLADDPYHADLVSLAVTGAPPASVVVPINGELVFDQNGRSTGAARLTVAVGDRTEIVALSEIETGSSSFTTLGVSITDLPTTVQDSIALIQEGK